MNLPPNPGLYRRLAYGEYIRTRHRARLFTNNYNYERLVELEDVEVGLSNRELSCIFKNNNCITQFFCSVCQDQDQDQDQDQKYDTNQDQEQKYDTNQEIKTLICNHMFHDKCIRKWLSKNKTCPVCRLDLSSD